MHCKHGKHKNHWKRCIELKLKKIYSYIISPKKLARYLHLSLVTRSDAFPGGQEECL